MDTPPEPDANASSSRRSLRAIVFTDVVRFTRHVAADEVRAIAAMGRDFDLFRRLCAEHGGETVNTMGDGMLLTFPSAVEAMRCAVAIQREVHRRALADPSALRLEHRIGVHVGDVVEGPDGPMGDGVNVAARVESLCRPSAVAFSRAVHEVIRGRYDPPGATYLGPRRGKNLEEPIPIWEVPPVADALAPRSLDDRLPAPPADTGATGRRAALIFVLALAILGVAAFAFVSAEATLRARQRGKSSMESLAGDRPRRRTALRRPAPTDQSSPPPDASPAPGTNAAPSTRTPEDLARRMAEMRLRYDFAAIVALLKEDSAASLPGAAELLARYSLLDATRAWAEGEIAATMPESPLIVSGATSSTQIFAGPSGVVVRESGKADAALDLWGRPPEYVLAVLRALEAAPNLRAPAPTGGVAAFATEYSLPPS